MAKSRIEYPCKWIFRIIGKDEFSVREAISGPLKGMDYSLSLCNLSQTGKYISLELATVVNSEESRNKIYTLLCKHPSIKMVL